MKHFTNPTAKQDIKRKVRLEELLARIEAFLPVTKTSIKSALTSKEFSSFLSEHDRISLLGLRSKNARRALGIYNKLLRKADLLSSALARKKNYTILELRHPLCSPQARISRAYGIAFEFLENSPEIWLALDRPVLFGVDDGTDSDNPESAPRMRSSSSDQSLSHEFVVRNEITDLKVRTLKSSLEALEKQCKTSFCDWNFTDVDNELL